MPKTRFVPFPDVRDIMEGGFSRKPLSNKELGDKIGKSATLISYFRNGIRAPSEEEANSIGDAFFPRLKNTRGDPFSKDRKEFVQKLLAASKSRTAGPSGNSLEDLAAGLVDFTVTRPAYPPIAGDSDCFFEMITSRLFDLCGIRFPEPRNRVGFDAKDCSEDPLLPLALFDSPNRMLHLKFFRVPLRMTLGGICHRQFRAQRRKIARVLANLDNKTETPLRPIVVPGEVGWVHCLRRLKFNEGDLVNEVSDPKILAERLIKETTESASTNMIPVVCVDDLTAFRVFKLMGEDGLSVFPMNSQHAAQDDRARRELPMYYSSLAVRRGNSDLQDFMQDALWQLLSTEIQTTANLWFEVAKKLISEIFLLPLSIHDFNAQVADLPESLQRAYRWKTAWEWVRYSLHLDSAAIEAYTDSMDLPWKPILRRTRQLMHRYFADKRDIVAGQVDLAFQLSRHPGRIERADVSALCDLFDIDLRPEDKNTLAKYGGHRKQLAHTIQSALLGRPPELSVEVRDFDAADSSNRVANMRGLMRNLQNMYKSMGDPGVPAVLRIEEEISRLSEIYGEGQGRIILAFMPEQPDVAIGGVCLSGLKSGAGCELRYLWVNSKYRGYGIGGQLIEHAVQVARDHFCTSIFVEVLHELKDARKLVSDQDFVASAREPSAKGRLVLERRFAPAESKVHHGEITGSTQLDTVMQHEIK